MANRVDDEIDYRPLDKGLLFEKLKPEELARFRRESASKQPTFEYIDGKLSKITKNRKDPHLAQILERNKRYNRVGTQPSLVENKIEELAAKYKVTKQTMRKLITAPYHFIRGSINNMELQDYEDAKTFYIPYFAKLYPVNSRIIRRMALLKHLKEGLLNGSYVLRSDGKVTARTVLVTTPEDQQCMERGW